MVVSLFVFLLFEGIKEEEERWRRKVICKEAELVLEVKEISTIVEEVVIVGKF